MRSVRRTGWRSEALLAGAAAFVVMGCAGAQRADVAGTVESVLNPTAVLNDEPVSGGDVIPYEAVLVTDESGMADIRLLGGVLTCRLLNQAELHVGLPGGTAWELVTGSTVCRSTAEDSARAVVGAKGRRVEVGAATFAVEVAEEGAVVRNVDGEVRVTDAPSPDVEPREIPAGHAVEMPSDPAEPVGRPTPFQPGDVPDLVLDAMTALAASSDTPSPTGTVTTEATDTPAATPSIPDDGTDAPPSDPATPDSTVTDATDDPPGAEEIHDGAGHGTDESTAAP